ncbi:hypothetical protein ZIOFF_039564 [Zingiber officinale]|uniref:Uncharacterized protein n=1 Tax=Zingiber officinale TaxID=94328 RepID=A0A8J5GG57_ZINOF|nr:hypothetical protein ZIOFF_039564 [Zingiber officinale]
MIAQEKAIYRTKLVLVNAIEEVYKELVPEHMVIVNLGCSSDPNTFIMVSQVCKALLLEQMAVVDLSCSDHAPNMFLVVSDQVLNIIVELRRMMEMKKPLEVQFLLNDLPGNDFNYVFQSLHKFKKKVEEETKGELLVSYYVVGVPGSFYGRLFPRANPLGWKKHLPKWWKTVVFFKKSRASSLSYSGMRSDIDVKY